MQREFKISLSQEFYSDVVYLSQYDEDYPLIFTVFDKYAKANSINGCTAELTGLRPDGMGFTYTATAVGHTVSFTIDGMLTGLAGRHTGEIIFYKDTTKRMGTANIQIVVEPAARPDGTIDGDVERCQEIAAEVQEIVDNAYDAIYQEGEAWATGKRGGVDVGSDDDTYHNNAKYYAESISGVTSQVGQNTADISVLNTHLTAELISGNAFDILRFCNHVSEEHRYVTFTWNSDNTSCVVSGTASGGAAFDTFFNGANSFPKGMQAGGTYRLKHSATNVKFQAYAYINGVIDTTNILASITADKVFTVPSNATGILLRLAVSEGATASETVSPKLFTDALTNAELTASYNDFKTSISERIDADNGITDAIVCDDDMSIQWIKHYYIHATTGKPVPSDSSSVSITPLIRVPHGAKLIVSSFSPIVRYATYDRYGNAISVYTDNFGINFAISSEDASYIRLQYTSESDASLSTISVKVLYPDGLAHLSDLTGQTGFSDETGTATGNPIVISDSALIGFDDIDLSDEDTNEVLSICGKNIFNFQHKAKLGITSNGVTFRFSMATNVMTIESANGATATAISANNTMDGGCTQLDGVTAYHNFHFRLAVDTPVTVTPNYSYDPYYDDKILLFVIWAENGSIKQLPIGYEGATFTAKAGVQYGLRVRVSTGFKGTVTLSPQVEIGTDSTEYERYHGADVVMPVSDGVENAFELDEENRLVYSASGSNVTAEFGYATKTVHINANDPSAGVAVYHPDYDGTVNGNAWLYLFKFTPGATPVCVSGLPKGVVGLAYAQISDGTNTTYVYDDKPVMITAEANKEYAYRLYVLKNSTFDCTFTPVIATGKEAIKLFGSSYPVTSIYTDGDADLSVKYGKATNAELLQTAKDVAKKVNVLTAGKIAHPFKRLKGVGPIVTFIDDDTTNPTLVQRFHDIFADEDVVGNYAVEMKNVDDNSGLEELLLEYEQEGFGMLYHCYKQAGDADRYWESGNEMYDESLIRANFYRGLREYKQVGFNSARYWVTPYGVNDEFIRRLAREADMECLLSCPTSTYACNAVLGLGSNYCRYNLPRTIFLSDTDNDHQSKMFIDGCAEANGWLIIVTHVNSWPSAMVETNTARLTALIQYAKAAGCRIANFMDAYQTFKPLLMLNELF